MRVADFDYQLPEELIAQAPVSPRDASRLLHLPAAGPAEHRAFADLPDLLRAGDLLVLNDTRVTPARLVGSKEGTGGKVEMLLVDPIGGELPRRWRALGQASKAVRLGARLRFGDLGAEVVQVEGEGFYQLLLDREGDELAAALARNGRLPLPPYIRREPTAEDAERYQTIFARSPGSAAAPTAGLHFTAAVLERLAARGVERTAVTLHVGPGTFLPVRGDSVEGHRMHQERYLAPPEAARAVEACRARGGRVVAAGTTAVRALESAWREERLHAGAGLTALFIRPGHAFGAVDVLLTNFHLPRSTLLMLVCAFGGRARVLAAYAEAVRLRYRFFSYGDAMLLERGSTPTAP
jgi:S-adenosylmethionine:tRNA ribosyltransferase-isomerase